MAPHLLTSGRVARLGLITTAISIGSVMALALPAAAAQAPVGLGTATSFAVLAGSGITNTGPTTITGDIGTFPTPTETGFASITQIGTNHAGDAVTQSAKTSLVTAYADASGRTPVTNVPTELGGTTLAPGVYTSPTLGLTGTLILDAGGDPGAQFIFQAASTLITATNSRVLLINGASACRVAWQVGSSATFNAGTSFVGDVLALTSISAQTAATFQGRLLARNGAVTLDTNTITNAACGTAGTDTAGTDTDGTDTDGTDTDGTDTDGTDDGPAEDGTTTGSDDGSTAADGTGGATDGSGTGVPRGTPTRLAFTGAATTDRALLGIVIVGAGTVAVMAADRRRRAAVRR